MKTDPVKSLQASHKGSPCPSREEGGPLTPRPHRPPQLRLAFGLHLDLAGTWQRRTRNPSLPSKTQGCLRSFPKHKPNNKVDKEILK